MRVRLMPVRSVSGNIGIAVDDMRLPAMRVRGAEANQGNGNKNGQQEGEKSRGG